MKLHAWSAIFKFKVSKRGRLLKRGGQISASAGLRTSHFSEAPLSSAFPVSGAVRDAVVCFYACLEVNLQPPEQKTSAAGGGGTEVIMEEPDSAGLCFCSEDALPAPLQRSPPCNITSNMDVVDIPHLWLRSHVT